MKIIPFEDLYATEFYISEIFTLEQNWFDYKNQFSCIGMPKPSHTFLWFKNCTGIATDNKGNKTEISKNQLVYFSKESEYHLSFSETKPNQVDTVLIHFQLKNSDGEDISPTMIPTVCINNVNALISMLIENIVDEYKKNIVCIPEMNSALYNIFSHICKNLHKTQIEKKYNCIREGIYLLENNSDMLLNDIAKICGISEGHFRRLFKEYSGYNPVEFRQIYRLKKAKQLLLSGTYSISEIAEELHFSDIYHFSKSFKKAFGVSPNKYVRTLKKS